MPTKKDAEYFRVNGMPIIADNIEKAIAKKSQHLPDDKTTLLDKFKPRPDLAKKDVIKFILICTAVLISIITFYIISISIKLKAPGAPGYDTFKGTTQSCAGWAGNDLGC